MQVIVAPPALAVKVKVVPVFVVAHTRQLAQVFETADDGLGIVADEVADAVATDVGPLTRFVLNDENASAAADVTTVVTRGILAEV